MYYCLPVTARGALLNRQCQALPGLLLNRLRRRESGNQQGRHLVFKRVAACCRAALNRFYLCCQRC
jgi:hypothetical protein